MNKHLQSDTRNIRPLAVSKKEASVMLNLSVRTIEKYIAAGKITARKFGRRTVIPVAALELFLENDQDSFVSKPSGDNLGR